MLNFQQDQEYSRPDVKEIAGLPRYAKGGNWDTGVLEHENEFIIFANVGVAGRTGHTYSNRWEGSLLRWSHKNGSHLGWQSVERLLQPDRAIHVFWRSFNEERFKYAGKALAAEIVDSTPVEVLWAFGPDIGKHTTILSPEEAIAGGHSEGAVVQVMLNRYERDGAAREACVRHYGAVCLVCDLSFEQRYGPLGAGFIHVHHLLPLSELGIEYLVDPIKHLRPVCPNCHAMLHRKNPVLSIEELRSQMVAGEVAGNESAAATL